MKPKQHTPISGEQRRLHDSGHRKLTELLETNAATHDTVYGLACALRDEGMEQTTLYRLFSGVLAEWRREDNDNFRVDILLDTLDAIHSGPWGKTLSLFEQELDESSL